MLLLTSLLPRLCLLAALLLLRRFLSSVTVRLPFLPRRVNLSLALGLTLNSTLELLSLELRGLLRKLLIPSPNSALDLPHNLALDHLPCLSSALALRLNLLLHLPPLFPNSAPPRLQALDRLPCPN